MKTFAVRTRFGDNGGQNNEALNSIFPDSAPSGSHLICFFRPFQDTSACIRRVWHEIAGCRYKRTVLVGFICLVVNQGFCHQYFCGTTTSITSNGSFGSSSVMPPPTPPAIIAPKMEPTGLSVCGTKMKAFVFQPVFVTTNDSFSNPIERFIYAGFAITTKLPCPIPNCESRGALSPPHIFGCGTSSSFSSRIDDSQPVRSNSHFILTANWNVSESAEYRICTFGLYFPLNPLMANPAAFISNLCALGNCLNSKSSFFWRSCSTLNESATLFVYSLIYFSLSAVVCKSEIPYAIWLAATSIINPPATKATEINSAHSSFPAINDANLSRSAGLSLKSNQAQNIGFFSAFDITSASSTKIPTITTTQPMSARRVQNTNASDSSTDVIRSRYEQIVWLGKVQIFTAFFIIIFAVLFCIGRSIK